MKVIPIINLNFQGYFLPGDASIPDTPGIYVAYAVKEILGLKIPTGILYIGKSEDESPYTGIKGRINAHKLYDHAEWVQNLSPNEKIMYAFSTLPEWAWHKIPNIEAALININKPVCNSDFVESVPSKYDFEELIRLNGLCPIHPKLEISHSDIEFKD